MNNKKYLPVNDVSQSKNDINSQQIQDQKILFDTSSSNEIELFKQETSGMNEKKIYILANDDCKIWHNSKIKCISYHGLELMSLYHPLNDRKNLYVNINKNGEYENVISRYLLFDITDFIIRINYVINENGQLEKIIKISSRLNFILWCCITIICVFLSLFSFFFLYCLSSYIVEKEINFNQSYINKIYFVFCVNVVLLIILFYGKVKIEKKKIFAIFIHLQMIRDKIQNEIDTWNKKSFASMNRKAILANNFEYINIKHI